MAGFFYLGGRENNNNKQDHHNHNHQVDKSNYLYLYKDEIYNTNKGFEIWPQEQENEQEQHVSSTPTNFYSFGMLPSGSSSNRSRSLYFNFHEQPLLRSTSGGSGLNGGGFTVTRQGGMNCQDCGNQAKKDCQHMRCRTCCKSRGFHCQTHVKSTWVPAAKRRERLAQLSSLQNSRHNATATATASSSAAAAKRHREADDHRDVSGSAPVLNPNSNSGLELVSNQNLPPEVNSPAVFRCVRVSSIEEDEDEEEYAYQTAVNIGGHVFKGILYDQGPESDHHYCYNTTSSPPMAETSQHNHHLSLLASTATNTNTNAMETGTKRSVSNNNGLILDPNSSVYSAPMNTYISGTQFFPNPRS